jgi:ribosomal protein S18 acetylase RimI-like enzyme
MVHSQSGFVGGKMIIEYKQTKEFTPAELKRLFLSVNWESGRYPEKLVNAMRNSEKVISAWDGDKLVGLIRALDDGNTVAFLHYLLVDPEYQGYHIGDNLMKQIMSFYEDILYVKVIPSDIKTIPFYERYGFKQYDNYSAMVKKNYF